MTRPASDAGEASLFEYEVRRESRVVARLHAFPSDIGVTVESTVFPITQPPDGDPITRPFPFSTIEQARRFADEAVVAFEYLNCTVS